MSPFTSLSSYFSLSLSLSLTPHHVTPSSPLHPITDQFISISLLLLAWQGLPQQPLRLVLKGGQVSPGAGCHVSPPGGPRGAGGHLERL